MSSVASRRGLPSTLTTASRARTTARTIARSIFSFPVMLGAMLCVLAFLSVHARFNDPDTWWHLRTGQIIWTTHSIPKTDLYSFTTHHHAWIAHEWLSQLLIYASFRWNGYTGMMLLLSLLVAAILVGGYALCSLYSGNAKTAFLGALVVWFFASIGFSLRPQLVGYLLLIVELLLIELGRTRSRRWFFTLPPLFALWVNCHGSFSLGLMVLAIVLGCSFFTAGWGLIVCSPWESSRRRALVWAGLFSLAALFLNPVGIRQVLYPLNALLHQPLDLTAVQEWMPLQITDPRGVGLVLVLFVIALLALVRRAQLLLPEVLTLALVTWLALSHQRMAFVFGILAAPVLSRLIAPLWDRYEPQQDLPFMNAAMIVICLLVLWRSFPSRITLDAAVREGNPAAAVGFINSQHLAGPMLNAYTMGGYLIWALPEQPVFIDGRGDVYDWTGVFAEYGEWATLRANPNTLLDKYGIHFCLLEANSPMRTVMALLPNWKLIYADRQAVIFQRSR